MVILMVHSLAKYIFPRQRKCDYTLCTLSIGQEHHVKAIANKHKWKDNKFRTKENTLTNTDNLSLYLIFFESSHLIDKHNRFEHQKIVCVLQRKV